VFIAGIGFFQTVDKFSNTYSQTQTFTVKDKSITLEKLNVIAGHNQLAGDINWVEDLDIISTKS
jgi:hypothetical protein